jgi:hypothetical protein
MDKCEGCSCEAKGLCLCALTALKGTCLKKSTHLESALVNVLSPKSLLKYPTSVACTKTLSMRTWSLLTFKGQRVVDKVLVARST